MVPNASGSFSPVIVLSRLTCRPQGYISADNGASLEPTVPPFSCECRNIIHHTFLWSLHSLPSKHLHVSGLVAAVLQQRSVCLLPLFLEVWLLLASLHLESLDPVQDFLQLWMQLAQYVHHTMSHQYHFSYSGVGGYLLSGVLHLSFVALTTFLTQDALSQAPAPIPTKVLSIIKYT